jgi:phenol 2-monooxygenase
MCRWTHGTLQQGDVEEIMKRRVKRLSGVTVHYDTSLCALDVDTSQLSSPDAYPCSVSLQQTREGNTQIEKLRSRYVIGADGGKSTTRNLLGFDMLGDQGSSVWGVMDFKGTSDFPE